MFSEQSDYDVRYAALTFAIQLQPNAQPKTISSTADLFYAFLTRGTVPLGESSLTETEVKS